MFLTLLRPPGSTRRGAPFPAPPLFRAAGVARGEAIGAFGERPGPRGDPPRRVFGFVADEQRRQVLRVVAGQNRGVAGLAGEAVGGGDRADARRLMGEPIGPIVGAEDVERAGGLALFGRRSEERRGGE